MSILTVMVELVVEVKRVGARLESYRDATFAEIQLAPL